MAKNDPRPEVTTRSQAIEWWNKLSSAKKTELTDTNRDIVMGSRRWETITGREVEAIWQKEGPPCEC